MQTAVPTPGPDQGFTHNGQVHLQQPLAHSFPTDTAASHLLFPTPGRNPTTALAAFNAFYERLIHSVLIPQSSYSFILPLETPS